MVDTEKFVSYYGKKLEELLNDLVGLEKYEKEKEAELEVTISGFGRIVLDMVWYAPLKFIPNRFIKPFLKDKIKSAWFTEYDNGRSKIEIYLEY